MSHKALPTPKSGIWSARDVQPTGTRAIQATGADAKGFASLAAAFTFTWTKAAIHGSTCPKLGVPKCAPQKMKRNCGEQIGNKRLCGISFP